MQNDTPEALKTTSAESVPAGFVIASAERRFANFLLDTLFFYAFSFSVVVVLVLIGLGSLLHEINQYVLTVLLLFLYYVPQEAINGRTFAKWITKTKVISASGGPISLGQATGRTACRFIPFEPFSVLANGAIPRGWHDSIPKTYVISLAKA